MSVQARENRFCYAHPFKFVDDGYADTLMGMAEELICKQPFGNIEGCQFWLERPANLQFLDLQICNFNSF